MERGEGSRIRLRSFPKEHDFRKDMICIKGFVCEVLEMKECRCVKEVI